MSTRGDATYDLVMIALGWVDEMWSRVYDRVKAWAGEETGDEVAAAMVGWRETYGILCNRVSELEAWRNGTIRWMKSFEKEEGYRERIKRLEKAVSHQGLSGDIAFLRQKVMDLEDKSKDWSLVTGGLVEANAKLSVELSQLDVRLQKLETALQELDAGHGDVMRKTAMLIAAGAGR